MTFPWFYKRIDYLPLTYTTVLDIFFFCFWDQKITTFLWLSKFTEGNQKVAPSQKYIVSIRVITTSLHRINTIKKGLFDNRDVRHLNNHGILNQIFPYYLLNKVNVKWRRE